MSITTKSNRTIQYGISSWDDSETQEGNMVENNHFFEKISGKYAL